MVAAGVVAAITAVLAGGGMPVWGEVAVFHAVNRLPGADGSAIDQLAALVLMLGTLAGTVLVTAVVAVVTRRVEPVAAVASAAVLARLGSDLVKEIVGRQRPVFLPVGVEPLREIASGYGYPSTHTATCVAMALAIGWWWPRARIPALAVAGLVAVLRMYVGVHLPLDLVGGAALGLLAGVTGQHIGRAVERRTSP